MLDLQYICEHLDAVAENCRNRGVEVDLDKNTAHIEYLDNEVEN